MADRLGFALVAPSNGLGNWTEDESRNGLENALAAAAKFASVSFLSPVFDPAEIRSGSFAEQCRNRRALVVTGSTDDRVPLDYVEENAARTTRTGAQVTLKTFDRADHFLFFSHRAELLQVLEEWFLGGG